MSKITQINKLITLSKAAKADPTLLINHLSNGVKRDLETVKLELVELRQLCSDEPEFCRELANDIAVVTEAIDIYTKLQE